MMRNFMGGTLMRVGREPIMVALAVILPDDAGRANEWLFLMADVMVVFLFKLESIGTVIKSHR